MSNVLESRLAHSRDGSPSPLRTELSVVADARRLVAQFRCEYRVLTPIGDRHDDDLFEGDVVELFVAPDPGDRTVYYEIEVNPEGLIFDARVTSPDLRRPTMRVDRSWNPVGLRVRSRCFEPTRAATGLWLVRIAIDWEELCDELPPGPERSGPDEGIPRLPPPIALGAFRIDRRSTDTPLFLALAPNGAFPPDFHRPDRFVVFDPGSGERGATSTGI